MKKGLVGESVLVDPAVNHTRAQRRQFVQIGDVDVSVTIVSVQVHALAQKIVQIGSN